MTSLGNLSRDGETVFISGIVNLDTVSGLANDLESLLSEGVNILDLSNVTQMDSSAVSLLVLLLGIANRRNMPIKITGASPSINSLMELYGVREFFNVKRDSASLKI